MFDSIKDLLIQTNSDKQSGHRYGFIYDLLFTRLAARKQAPLTVLEIGVSAYGDGSLKAYADSDMVEYAVGIDIEPYRGTLTKKMRFHLLDAYSEHTIDYLKVIEGEFDIIIDDGTHRHAHQEFFLQHYTSLLAENGLLVCEDVSSVKLINEQCADDSVFFFDGWGNRKTLVQSWESSELYKHTERMLIKAKSEKLTDAKRHENKAHIAKLPVVKFGDYERNSTELAVSVPLFHPELDSYDVGRFQEVHCKGAIWAGMSLIKNSDLGDCGVPLFFHIEDKVWDAAMPVFKQFGVPEHWCRKMTLPAHQEQHGLKIDTKPQFGKSWMGLTDAEVDPDVLLILDSDFFTCVTGEKFKIYEKLTAPSLKKQPSMTYFAMKELPYWWWVSIILLASGLPDRLMHRIPLDTLERDAYQRLGFERELSKDIQPHDVVKRFYAEDYLMTFPREHPARDFAISRMLACYATPYIFSVWAEFNHPFLELDRILEVPVYDWEREFIEGKHGYDCFSHIRAQKLESPKLTLPSRIHEYWDTFFENVSRHV